jgi:hypothetical protein
VPDNALPGRDRDFASTQLQAVLMPFHRGISRHRFRGRKPLGTRADDAVAYCVEHGAKAYEHWARFCQALALARSDDPHDTMEGSATRWAQQRKSMPCSCGTPSWLPRLRLHEHRPAGRPTRLFGRGNYNHAGIGRALFSAELHRLRASRC